MKEFVRIIVEGTLDKLKKALDADFVGLFYDKYPIIVKTDIDPKKTERIEFFLGRLIKRSKEIDEIIKDFNEEYLFIEGKNIAIFIQSINKHLFLVSISSKNTKFSLVRLEHDLAKKKLSRDIKEIEKFAEEFIKNNKELVEKFERLEAEILRDIERGARPKPKETQEIEKLVTTKEKKMLPEKTEETERTEETKPEKKKTEEKPKEPISFEELLGINFDELVAKRQKAKKEEKIEEKPKEAKETQPIIEELEKQIVESFEEPKVTEIPKEEKKPEEKPTVPKEEKKEDKKEESEEKRYIPIEEFIQELELPLVDPLKEELEKEKKLEVEKKEKKKEPQPLPSLEEFFDFSVGEKEKKEKKAEEEGTEEDFLHIFEFDITGKEKKKIPPTLEEKEKEEPTIEPFIDLENIIEEVAKEEEAKKDKLEEKDVIELKEILSHVLPEEELKKEEKEEVIEPIIEDMLETGAEEKKSEEGEEKKEPFQTKKVEQTEKVTEKEEKKKEEKPKDKKEKEEKLEVKYINPIVLDILLRIFSKEMGPIAKLIFKRKKRELGIDEKRLTIKALKELITALAEEIPVEYRKARFLENAKHLL
jgi:predicted regulator of Ras-like GTPase activity (Roadblock/LC7/MglB family)